MGDEPYPPATVRRLCRGVIQYGTVAFTRHAQRRMAERNIAEIDVKNVLRGGHPEGVSSERGTWRYTVWTPKITVQVAFRSEEHLVVVTAWRNES